jgi:hypothetical protein
LCIAGNIENSKPAVESPAALNVQTAAEKVRYRNTAKSSCSVSIPLPQDLKKRLDQYLVSSQKLQLLMYHRSSLARSAICSIDGVSPLAPFIVPNR